MKVLLQHNAKVYIAARSKEKATDAIASLKQETGREALFLALDLSSLASIKAAADEFLAMESHLHILFNNAYALLHSDLLFAGWIHPLNSQRRHVASQGHAHAGGL